MMCCRGKRIIRECISIVVWNDCVIVLCLSSVSCNDHDVSLFHVIFFLSNSLSFF